MVDGRKEVVPDQGGINILPGIVDGNGRKTGQLKQTFEQEEAGLHAPAAVVKRAEFPGRIFFLVGKCGQQHLGFSGGKFNPDKPVLKCFTGAEWNAQGSQQPIMSMPLIKRSHADVL